MANTLTSIVVHVTFSTKHREPLVPADLFDELFRFMGGVCRDMQCPLLHAGGVSDHVHLLISLSKTKTVADLMMHAKRSSSAWIKQQRAGLNRFAWQDGYFAFSVGHGDMERVRAYFDKQAEHHRRVDFRSELLKFLKKYGVPFNESYLWD